MTTLLLITSISAALSLAACILTFFRRGTTKTEQLTAHLDKQTVLIANLHETLTRELKTNREEASRLSSEGRQELNATLKDMRKEITDTLAALLRSSQDGFDKLSVRLEQRLDSMTEKNSENAKENRVELSGALKAISETHTAQLENISKQVETKLGRMSEESRTANKVASETLSKSLLTFQHSFDRNVQSFNDLQREKFSQLEEKQSKLMESTEKKLEEMRIVVDEKLQKTLNERLGQSFETVGKQLIEVQRGLGEMQTLAQDVGGLKKVLSNVKMRGGIGEVQLSLLLEQILAPDQYMKNVKTKSGSADLVEFAIKLPGRHDGQDQVWLPIDAKFPKDYYEQLQDAYDTADPAKIEYAQKNLEAAIRKMARDIRDKYIDPPSTTDFGIMFLPFEGIYAEVVRKAALLEELQRDCNIIVTGPTTLAALLNSLQVGFKTLAIQKRSSEVWQVLGAVKKEFENFGGLLSKAQNNIQTGLNQLDDVMGRRTRAIQRKLRGVEALGDMETRILLPELAELEVEEEV